MPVTASGITGLFDDVVDRLTPVPPEQRRAFAEMERTRPAHARAYAEAPAFRQVEVGGAVARAAGGQTVRLAAWNLERCLYPAEAARALRLHHADVSLLTEMDVGARRTGQAHTIAEIAAGLDQGYAYGLEFLELNPTLPPPGQTAIEDADTLGFHGNGIVSALIMEEPAVIRLDEEADWFIDPPAPYRRIGNRIALAAIMDADGFRFAVCAVHLENRTDGMGRAAQMRTLLDTLDGYAAGLPVVIGGDLNTRVDPGRHDDGAERLFAVAKARGYDFAACNLAGLTTRSSLFNPRKTDHQLDWFLTRGLRASDPAIVPALGPDGTVLSDHELILLTVSPA